MIDRFEAVLHPLFGEQEYWLVRFLLFDVAQLYAAL